MASLKSTLETIILGLYEYNIKDNCRIFSINKLTYIIQNIITVMPVTIANYLKQLKILGYIEITNNESFYLTDKLLEKGKVLYSEKIEPVGNTETDKNETDELGFSKY